MDKDKLIQVMREAHKDAYCNADATPDEAMKAAFKALCKQLPELPSGEYFIIDKSAMTFTANRDSTAQCNGGMKSKLDTDISNLLVRIEENLQRHVMEDFHKEDYTRMTATVGNRTYSIQLEVTHKRNRK